MEKIRSIDDPARGRPGLGARRPGHGPHDDASAVLARLAVQLARRRGLAAEDLIEAAARHLGGRPMAAEELLREAHHRYKNSLQILSSATMAEAARRPGVDCTRCVQRIQAIARLEDGLQLSDGPDLRLDTLLDRVCRQLVDAFAGDGRVALEFRGQRILVPAALAQPALLIANEAVMNALKHAFPDGRRGRIGVVLARAGGDRVSLVVSDDGLGAGRAGSAPAASWGSRLMQSLARTIGGTLATRSDGGGTRLELVFPLGQEG